MEYRQCKQCPPDTPKPLTKEYFPTAKLTQNNKGLSYWCRECANRKRREYWQAKTETEREEEKRLSRERYKARQRAKNRLVQENLKGPVKKDRFTELFIEELGPRLRMLVIDRKRKELQKKLETGKKRDRTAA